MLLKHGKRVDRCFDPERDLCFESNKMREKLSLWETFRIFEVYLETFCAIMCGHD